MTWTDLVAIIGDTEPGSVRFDSTSTVVYLNTCDDYEAVCERGHAKTVSDKTSSIGATRHVRTREAMDASAREGQGGLLVAHLCWPWSPCSAFHEEPQDGEVARFPADPDEPQQGEPTTPEQTALFEEDA